MAANCNKLGPLHTVTEKSLTDIAGSEAQVPKSKNIRSNSSRSVWLRSTTIIYYKKYVNRRTLRRTSGERQEVQREIIGQIKQQGRKLINLKKLNLKKELYN